MTYTIELDASEERVLEAAARRRGVALDTYLREVLMREAQGNQEAETARREAVRAGYGKFANLGPTPEERRQWKEEEMRREVENNEPRATSKKGAAFLELLDKARPVIAAGVLRPLTSENVNSAIDATRDRDLHESDARLLE